MLCNGVSVAKASLYRAVLIKNRTPAKLINRIANLRGRAGHMGAGEAQCGAAHWEDRKHTIACAVPCG